MLILEAKDISKQYGDRLLFHIDALRIYSRDRIGVVGPNGAGKTTLINILAGKIPADSGDIHLYGEYSYITQLEDGLYQPVTAEMAKKFRVSGINVDKMSGGEIARFKLAQSFSKNPHILFADEPTSSLDIAGIKLLEDCLKSFKGALVIISHDRALLDILCNKILEVENRKVTQFSGNYSDYKVQKEAELRRGHFEYQQYLKEKNRLMAAMREKQQKSGAMKKTPSRMGNSEARLHKRKINSKRAKIDKSANAVKSRIEKLEGKEKPKEMPKIKMDIGEHLKLNCKVVVKGKDISKSFGGRVLFYAGSFQINNHSRTALLGDNGSGKTTLIRMIVDNQKGIKQAKGLKIGYFTQNMHQLDNSGTVLENVLKSSIYPVSEVRTLLARLLFKREDVHKEISFLSGGERVKVALAQLFVADINMLILDEPTNHLDIYSVEALEGVLKEYPGTLLLVSHDRRLIEQIADHLIVIENQKLIQFEGNFTDYLNHKVSNAGNRARILHLENRLSDVISRLCIPAPGDDIPALDREYKEILEELKRFRGAEKRE